MRNQLLGAVAILSLAVAAPVFANPAADANPKKANPSEKIICKTEGSVGSRIRDRICKTRAEWELARTKSREVLDGMPREQFQAPDRAGPV